MKNIIKKLFCKFGWHSFDYDTVIVEVEDVTVCRNKCKWCGYEGLVDSQGNLF